jgi:hypothetical protein
MSVNFRINKAQAWTLANMGYYAEDEEIVIDAESYDPKAESFVFALQIKDEAPEAVWRGIVVNPNGWSFFTMTASGKVEGDGSKP